ncbi:hypothetical protein G9A89_017951 [Geosiphon pyriformis]|nr:hypothetical protein G9A89_017951 [Geosiphon pyriformis]
MKKTLFLQLTIVSYFLLLGTIDVRAVNHQGNVDSPMVIRRNHHVVRQEGQSKPALLKPPDFKKGEEKEIENSGIIKNITLEHDQVTSKNANEILENHNIINHKGDKNSEENKQNDSEKDSIEKYNKDYVTDQTPKPECYPTGACQSCSVLEMNTEDYCQSGYKYPVQCVWPSLVANQSSSIPKFQPCPRIKSVEIFKFFKFQFLNIFLAVMTFSFLIWRRKKLTVEGYRRLARRIGDP